MRAMTQLRPLVIGAIVLFACVAAYNYSHPAIDAGLRFINRKADSHELAKVDQAEPKIQPLVGGDDRKFGEGLKGFGAEDGARRIDREAALARARGETLPVPVRFLPGSRFSWQATDIPIYECTKLTAKGEIWRGDKPTAQEIAQGRDKPAGPDGEDYSHNDLHKYKDTVVPDLPWGTFIGKVCLDSAGRRCGAVFPIGSAAFVSPESKYKGVAIGAGHLWIWTNGFEYFNKTEHRTANYSDFNIVEGGFDFWSDLTPDYKCSASLTH